MKACDDEVIRARMSLDDLKKLFGDSPMFIVYPVNKKTGKQSAFLSFVAPQPATTGPIVQLVPDQEPRHGWYMWFNFEHDDLRLYYLTNYNK